MSRGASISWVLEQALGRELGGRIWQAMLLGELQTAVRERKAVGSSPRVSWRQFERVEHARHLRHFARFVLLVLERVGTESGKAAGSRLWLGPTRDGKRYVPAAEQLQAHCVAARVGVGVRELERYTAILEAAGVWVAWQPKEKGARAPERLPAELRGEVYAYNQYRLSDGVPLVLRENLERFYTRNKHQKRPAIDAAERTPDARASAAAAAVTIAPDVVGADAARGILAQLRNRPPT